MVTFRRRIYERMRRKLPTSKQGPAGETVILPAALPPGETCRLEYRGSSWSAVNGGQSVIAAGSAGAHRAGRRPDARGARRWTTRNRRVT